MSNKITKTAAILAAAAVFTTFTACGDSPDEQRGHQSVETYQDIDTGELKEVQIYDFPEESMFEILHGVKYGMTKEDVKSIEGEPSEEGPFLLKFDTSINNYQAVLSYHFFFFEPGDEWTQYQNVTGAMFTISLEGLSDAQIYNEYRDIRKTYMEIYGEPDTSVVFAINNPDLIMDGYPDIDGDINFNGDPFMRDEFSVQEGLEIVMSYSNIDDNSKGISIYYNCENPLNNSKEANSLSEEWEEAKLSEATIIEETTTTIEIATGATTNTENTKLGDERFLSLVKMAIEGDVGTGEEITDITFDEHANLCIYVDISHAHVPAGFDSIDIAVSRACSITDDILALDRDEYWNKIILDFGEVGRVVRPKEVIKEDNGVRYFEIERYNVKTDR